MAELAPNRMTYEAYLAAERSSETKHEYLRGEVYAMAGGTPPHAGLAMAVGVALSNALSGRACRVYGSDLRVRIEATDLSTYPDLTVSCGRFERADLDADAATNPILIVEVLSDSTEAYDRGEKFAHYRRLPSLREYLLVSQREPRLEAYAKNAEGAWVLSEAGPGEALALRSLEGVRLQIDDVYRDPLAGA
jgi:Uma2 family endonuclease